MEGEAGAERFGGALVEIRRGAGAPSTGRRRQSRVRRTPRTSRARTRGRRHRDGASTARSISGQALGVLAAARDEDRREMLERLDVIGIELERTARELACRRRYRPRHEPAVPRRRGRARRQRRRSVHAFEHRSQLCLGEDAERIRADVALAADGERHARHRLVVGRLGDRRRSRTRPSRSRAVSARRPSMRMCRARCRAAGADPASSARPGR